MIIFDNFKNWGCKIFSVRAPCYCKNNDPVSRYVCYKLYNCDSF